MLIYPVLDLKAGCVVHGVAGERQRYRPVRSRLVASAAPLEVARAYRRHFGFSSLYVADLDAIGGAPPALEILRELRGEGFSLLVDAGPRSAAEAEPLVALGGTRAVACLETLSGPRQLDDMVRDLGAGQLVFSLDLKGGRPISPSDDWPEEPLAIARRAGEAGVREILLLDLARVGSRDGPAHLGLCREIVEDLPGRRLLTGGGVRGPADLRLLEATGVAGVLLASALHDGTLRPEDFDGQ